MENKKSIQKYAFSGLSIELTRKCNLACEHCMCGEPQCISISHAVIDRFLEQTTAIRHLLLTGGEPLLEVGTLKYILDALEKYNVPVLECGFVTNGTILDEEVLILAKDFLDKNPLSTFSIQVSSDLFHDKEQSEKCIAFYNRLVHDRYSATSHGELSYLRHAGRVNGKKTLKGMAVTGTSDRAIRQHRIKINGNNVSCSVLLSANGNFGFGGDTSYETDDSLALGNVLESSLEDIFSKNFNECPCLCDECFKEVVLKNHEDFFTNQKILQRILHCGTIEFV